jgi:hypothetical protein
METAPLAPCNLQFLLRANDMTRDYLVFVRAGKSSLHEQMLKDDPGRNWDCCVNAWGLPFTPDPIAEYTEAGGINKFEAFVEIYKKTLSKLERPYRYVMLIDDDLQFQPGDVSRFFELCDRRQLYLTQPAIAWGSNANHLVNICNPVCEVRNVSFIEVMAPCLSAQAVDDLKCTFMLTRCTWGIDYAWSSLLVGKQRISVVDAVQMHHTKPMDKSGGPFYQMLRRLDIDPEQELAAVHERYPPFGPMHTLSDGHCYRWPLPRGLNERALAWMEDRKIDVHLRRGGTICGWTPTRGPDGRYVQPGP